jgi:hypothetical protein
MVLLVVHVAVNQGPDSNGALRIAVEVRRQAEMGPSAVGVTAQHAQSLDADRAGVVYVDGSPDAARVPVAIETIPVLEDPGDVAPIVHAGMRCTGDFDGEDVLFVELRECRDVEGVRKEVALTVTKVGAIEPHVGLVEDAVERDPTAGAIGWQVGGEAVSVHDRAVAGSELFGVAPVSGDLDRLPVLVVGVEPNAVPANIVVGLGRKPAAGKFASRRVPTVGGIGGHGRERRPALIGSDSPIPRLGSCAHK